MKNGLKLLLVIFFTGLLTACISITFDTGNQSSEINEDKAIPSHSSAKQEDEKENSKDADYDEKSNENKSDIKGNDTEIHQVALYFTDDNLTDSYRIEKEIEIKKGESIEKAALEEWINGPDHEDLSALTTTDIIVQSVEDVDGTVHVSFSKEIQDINLGSPGELMVVEQIAMIMQQFGFEQTQILVEGEIVETLLGHVMINKPLKANDPENYLWIDEIKNREIVLENEAFKIFEPVPHTEMTDQIIVRGLARVFEGTILYEFEDGHFILDKGFTSANGGPPGWGEFEIMIELDEVTNYSGSVILYEENAKDGSRINELIIPVDVKD